MRRVAGIPEGERGVVPGTRESAAEATDRSDPSGEIRASAAEPRRGRPSAGPPGQVPTPTQLTPADKTEKVNLLHDWFSLQLCRYQTLRTRREGNDSFGGRDPEALQAAAQHPHSGRGASPFSTTHLLFPQPKKDQDKGQTKLRVQP